jgi:hypothetical protein
VRVIVTVPLNVIIASSIVPVFVPMFVAMLIGAHRVVIVRSILGADQRRSYTRHGNGGECKQGGFPKMATHVQSLSDG